MKQVGVQTNPGAGVTSSVGPKPPTRIVVSGAGTSAANGIYTFRGVTSGKPYYNLIGQPSSIGNIAVTWVGVQWTITDGVADTLYESDNVTPFPWQVITWAANVGDLPVPTVRLG